MPGGAASIVAQDVATVDWAVETAAFIDALAAVPSAELREVRESVRFNPKVSIWTVIGTT